MTTMDPGAPTAEAGGLTRRRMLGVMGAGATLVAVGCTQPGTPTPPGGGGGICQLAPRQTEGPYYIRNNLVRRDITDGRPGTPLRLELRVQNRACAALPGASVDIWHCDASGAYSGFGAGSASRTFLRGTQIADGDGLVTFDTIYPGWYVGRAVHIHVKVHTGGREVHTGQLYFEESLNDAVFRTAPYSSRTGSRTRNASDFVYRNGGAQSIIDVSPASPGYLGRKTLAVSA
jgi:protocatechuate 3,4-dioxygenase beta subunit